MLPNYPTLGAQRGFREEVHRRGEYLEFIRMLETMSDNQVSVVENPEDTRPRPLQGVGLPLLALGLVFVPVLLGYIVTSLGWYTSGVVLLFFLLGPVAGLILGAICLSKAKKGIGIVGVILAAVAVAIPTIIIVFLLFFFVGVVTGLIPLM